MIRFLYYIYFLFHSKNEHSVHSPFVYNLLTNALHKKRIPFVRWKEYLKIKNRFLNDMDRLNVQDFGAGSKRLKAKSRKVSHILKTASISNKRARILFQLVNHLQPKSILEIGTSLGLSTSVLSIARPGSEIITLEGCPNILKKANQSFKINGLNNIKTMQGEFDTILPKVLKNKVFDFIYVDGNHTKQATISYFEMILDSINNDSCIVFDDIYWSKEMKQAWSFISKHSKVTVSIDTYQWGIVFFRKEQQKEHFILRI